jgi:hypothetical protein
MTLKCAPEKIVPTFRSLHCILMCGPLVLLLGPCKKSSMLWILIRGLGIGIPFWSTDVTQLNITNESHCHH